MNDAFWPNLAEPLVKLDDGLAKLWLSFFVKNATCDLGWHRDIGTLSSGSNHSNYFKYRVPVEEMFRYQIFTQAAMILWHGTYLII